MKPLKDGDEDEKQEEQTRKKFALKKAVKYSQTQSSAIFDTNGRSEEVVKKNEVVPGKKLTYLDVKILKIGHREAWIQPGKVGRSKSIFFVRKLKFRRSPFVCFRRSSKAGIL